LIFFRTMTNATEQRRAEAKWGPAGIAGLQIVPDLLLKHQTSLELTATEMLVLLNVTMHWWYPSQRPFPRSSIIARRMGVQTRTVQRAMERLRELGLVTKVKETINKDQEREVCDLSGLVSKLAELAETDLDYKHRVTLREETAT
jgi:DNA replication protein DnaD